MQQPFYWIMADYRLLANRKVLEWCLNLANYTDITYQINDTIIITINELPQN